MDVSSAENYTIVTVLSTINVIVIMIDHDRIFDLDKYINLEVCVYVDTTFI